MPSAAILSAVLAAPQPYAGFPFAFDPKSSWYRKGSLLVRDPSLLPDTYTRSGAKSEVSSGGSIVPFAANVPGIVPGDGYWSRAALTNLVLQSQTFDNAAWGNGGTAPTVTANTTIAPDGTLTADTIAFPADGASRKAQAVTVVASSPYTISIFAKVASGTGTFRLAYFNGSTNVVSSDFTVTTIYQQFTFALNSPSTAASVQIQNGSSGAAQSIIVWQAQLVAGSQLGPIILTTTTTAAIGADALAVSLANATYSAVYTFDDGSTQTIPTTISGGSFAMPVYPTTLNRPLVRLVTLK